jgi:hypothetical protein
VVDSTPFGISGVPEAEFATKSPSGAIEIAMERGFSTMAELLTYWQDRKMKKSIVHVNGRLHLQV